MKKPLLLGDIKKAKEQFASFKHDLQPQPASMSARAEVGLAWMQCTILKEKEDEEEAHKEQSQIQSMSGSSKAVDKGKGKGKMVAECSA